MFTILVCGGRNYADPDKVDNALIDLCDKHGLWDRPSSAARRWVRKDALRVISGAATGADTFALAWAVLNGASVKGYPPQYNKYPGYSAPVIRNQQMLDEEKVDLVIAFPGGAGTRDMISRAQKASIPVQIVK